MTRKLLTALVAALALGWAGLASAAIPSLMNFQGRLADASGTPKTGSFTMTFSLWTAASGGTACFTETQTVAANSGLVNVNIGSVTSLGTCDFAVPYWLQIQVGSDSAMSPRITLTAAAYAMRAATADNAVNLNGLTQGAGAGQIPSNSGVVQTSLNADLLDGHHWSEVPVVATPLYGNSSTCGGGSSVSMSPTCLYSRTITNGACTLACEQGCCTAAGYNNATCPTVVPPVLSGCSFSSSTYAAGTCTVVVSCSNPIVGFIR